MRSPTSVVRDGRKMGRLLVGVGGRGVVVRLLDGCGRGPVLGEGGMYPGTKLDGTV